MNKLLVICGPTATGKTKLALNLSQKYKVEIVSADSRQVYKGLDVGTGKDIPAGFRIYDSEFIGKTHYSDGETNIWGLDLVSPNEEFSVAHYYKYAREKIKEIWARNNLPVLVGGSGLYIKAVLEGVDTASVPPDKELRGKLESKSVDELFSLLQKKDPLKVDNLNDSDKKNKHRLIRAIEIASAPHVSYKDEFDADVLKIGLRLSKTVLKERIEQRILNRINAGFKAEVERLLLSGVGWSSQAMQSTGYRQYKLYLEGMLSFREFMHAWAQAEYKYVKRQLTWFKRDEAINWFSADCQVHTVADLVQKWYSSTR